VAQHPRRIRLAAREQPEGSHGLEHRLTTVSLAAPPTNLSGLSSPVKTDIRWVSPKLDEGLPPLGGAVSMEPNIVRPRAAHPDVRHYF